MSHHQHHLCNSRIIKLIFHLEDVAVARRHELCVEQITHKIFKTNKTVTVIRSKLLWYYVQSDDFRGVNYGKIDQDHKAHTKSSRYNDGKQEKSYLDTNKIIKITKIYLYKAIQHGIDETVCERVMEWMRNNLLHILSVFLFICYLIQKLVRRMILH